MCSLRIYYAADFASYGIFAVTLKCIPSPIFARQIHSYLALPNPLRLGQPSPRRSGVGVFEVSDRCFREWLTERRHAMLPYFFPNHGQSLNIGEVFDAKLEVFPRRASIPAVKAGHFKQYAQLSMLLNEAFKFRQKALIVCFDKLPADVNDENLSAVFFLELNGHCTFLWFIADVCSFQVQSSCSIYFSLFTSSGHSSAFLGIGRDYRCPEPSQGVVIRGFREVLDLGMHEMVGDFG